MFSQNKQKRDTDFYGVADLKKMNHKLLHFCPRFAVEKSII